MKPIHEINLWHSICASDYSDMFQTIQDLKEDTIYSKAELDQACAEAAYIIDVDKMPPWASVIESYEVVAGQHLFVYRDKGH
jgi:hypothetical protein